MTILLQISYERSVKIHQYLAKIWTMVWCLFFTARCTMCIARYCYSKSSICLSVRPSFCNVDVRWSYTLGSFENSDTNN